MPATIQKDVVGIFHYRLKNCDGDLIEESHGGQPLPYIHGRGNVMKGLESFLEGKKVGDCFKAEITAKDGFGEYNEDAFFQVHLKEFPPGQFEKLDEGGHLVVEDSQGKPTMVWVHKKEGSWCHLTTNHPLSGQRLVFEVEVVGIRDALPLELEENQPHGIDGSQGHQQDH